MEPDFPDHWGVSEPELIADTFSSLVWKVRLPDGAPAIVKALKPIEDIADGLRGGDYLAWRDGRGAVRLLGREDDRMLLEYAGERMLSHVVTEQGDDRATEIAIELMAELYAPPDEPLPSVLLPVRDRFEALFDRARRDRKECGRTEYVQAAGVADRLLADMGDVCGLHGDLHHDNIMLSHRGWLTIDPVGLAGDVGFDVANMFYDPTDRDDLCLDPRRIARMAHTFSHGLTLDPRRLLDQAYVYGALSAAWHAGAGSTDDERRDLAIATTISHVRRAEF